MINLTGEKKNKTNKSEFNEDQFLSLILSYKAKFHSTVMMTPTILISSLKKQTRLIVKHFD